MNKKRFGIIIAIIAALILGFIVYKDINPDEYVPSEDEIALHIQFQIKEDIGLLVYDYKADDYESSGGTSNANKTLMKKNSENVEVWDKQMLQSSSDTVELTIQFRIITEYVTPNFENIYPEDISKYLEPISWKANYGESYYITITGDKTNGYQASINE